MCFATKYRSMFPSKCVHIRGRFWSSFVPREGLSTRHLSTTCLFFNGLLLNFSTTSFFFNIGIASNVNFSPSVSRARLCLGATSFLSSPPCALMPWLLDGVRTGRIAPLETSLPYQLLLCTLDIATPVIS